MSILKCFYCGKSSTESFAYKNGKYRNTNGNRSFCNECKLEATVQKTISDRNAELVKVRRCLLNLLKVFERNSSDEKLVEQIKKYKEIESEILCCLEQDKLNLIETMKIKQK